MKAKQDLVIIDMQPGFKAALDEPTIKQVLIAIEEAKEAKLPIIIVELDAERYGSTLDSIMEAVDLYDDVHIVEKCCNDGGDEIEELLLETGIEIEEHVVCGVNIGACVHDTVDTLVNEYGRHCIMLQSACNCIHIEKQTYSDYEDKEAAFKKWPLFQQAEITLAGYPE